MRILLVLPATDHLRVTAERPQVPRRAMLRFSVLPLTTVAALTPPGHQVALCDENVEPLDLEAPFDLVGVSFMTALAPRAYEIARELRARGRVVVAGGYHPTLCPDEAAQHFDAVVVGDAEGSWPRVVADAEAGRLQRFYRREVPVDLVATPVPRRDLTEGTARHYVTVNAVQVGRGCVHGCRYCSVTAFHRRSYRARPLDHVLAELAGLPRELMFVDDNLVADPSSTRALFRAMIPLRKRWVGQCSVEIADDPELLRLARQSGCRGLFVGVESTDPDSLATLDKGFNQAHRLPQRLAAIRRQGIGVIAGMIVGLDRDRTGIFEGTLRFLERNRVDALQLNILTPLPGTPLFADMERQGRMRDRDWSHYDFRHVVIRPAQMTAGELQAGADWLYAQFYRLDRILRRFARALPVLGPEGAFLGLRLGLTYRYDNRREGVVGWNPAGSARQPASSLRPQTWTLDPSARAGGGR